MTLPRAWAMARRLLLVVASLGFAMGADPARVQSRDREVLEVVLNDVMDPRNPEYQGLEPGQLKRRGIVLHVETATSDPVYLGPTLQGAIRDRDVSESAGRDWLRRNSGPGVSTGDFRFKNRLLAIDDLDAIGPDGAGPDAFAEAFWKKHPGTWGWVFPTLPGFSPDGRTAAVLFRDGPSPHGAVWVYQLAWFQDHWNVVRREHRVWE